MRNLIIMERKKYWFWGEVNLIIAYVGSKGGFVIFYIRFSMFVF